MSRRSRTPRRADRSHWLAWIVVPLGLAVIVAIGYGIVQYNAQVDAATSDLDPEQTLSPTPSPTAAPDQPRLVLPESPKVVFLGDSWSTGYAADPFSKGFAFVSSEELGWSTTVIPDGGGTGYVNIGLANYGTYADRLAALPTDPDVDLLVLQGGINDAGLPSIASDGYNRAIVNTVSQARETFPNAAVVIMGPLWTEAVTPSGTVSTIDDRLGFTTTKLGVPYISPTQEHWLTSQGQLDRLIDPDKTYHPNTAGHAYLAKRFEAAIKALESRPAAPTKFSRAG